MVLRGSKGWFLNKSGRVNLMVDARLNKIINLLNINISYLSNSPSHQQGIVMKVSPRSRTISLLTFLLQSRVSFQIPQ